jgi:RNA polymerase sigma factor (sigma-70 family)
MVGMFHGVALSGEAGTAAMDRSGGAAPHELHEVIAQYRDDAYRLARRLSRSSYEAEDLAQTALLNVLRRAEFIVDETKVRSYLLTAVRNVWRNQLRARSNRYTLGSDAAEMIPSPDLEPEEQVLTLLDAAIARGAFTVLSATSRDVITLRYVEGLDYHDLASRLSISPVAARQRAHRAREELISACMELAAEGGVGTCRTVRRRIGRYHRGLLTRKVRAEMGLHLSQCDACRRCYEQVVDLYGRRIAETRGED